MNNEIVSAIAIELDRLNNSDDFKLMIQDVTGVDEHSRLPIFSSDYLNYEYDKIKFARDKLFPTYKSEYRTIKTLIRPWNELIYYIDTTYPDEIKERLNTQLVKISELSTSFLVVRGSDALS